MLQLFVKYLPLQTITIPLFQQSLYLSFLSSIGSDLSENEENGDDDHDITDESEDEESLSELTFSGRYLLTFVF